MNGSTSATGRRLAEGPGATCASPVSARDDVPVRGRRRVRRRRPRRVRRVSTTRTPRAPPRMPKPPVVIASPAPSVTVSFSAADGGTTATTTTTTTTAASMRDGDSRMASDSSDDEGEDDSRWRQRTVEYRLEVAAGAVGRRELARRIRRRRLERIRVRVPVRRDAGADAPHRRVSPGFKDPNPRAGGRGRGGNERGGVHGGEDRAGVAEETKSARTSVRHRVTPGGDGARARATRAAARAAASRPVIAARTPAVTRLASSPPSGALCGGSTCGKRNDKPWTATPPRASPRRTCADDVLQLEPVASGRCKIR